jgi:hypothetical protein
VLVGVIAFHGIAADRPRWGSLRSGCRRARVGAWLSDFPGVLRVLAIGCLRSLARPGRTVTHTGNQSTS